MASRRLEVATLVAKEPFRTARKRCALSSPGTSPGFRLQWDNARVLGLIPHALTAAFPVLVVHQWLPLAGIAHRSQWRYRSGFSPLSRRLGFRDVCHGSSTLTD